MTKLTQRALILGWVILAMFLLSSLANAQEATTIIQQGAFTIIQTPTTTTTCVRMGNMVQCQ